MRPLSIRSSLMAWFVGLVMLLLCGFSVLLYSMIGDALSDGLDARLREKAEALAAFCEWEDDIDGIEFDVPDEMTAGLVPGEPGRGQEISSWPDGRLLHRAGDAMPAVRPEVLAELASNEGSAVLLADLSGEHSRRLCAFLARVPATAASPTEPATPAFQVLVRVTESLAAIETQLEGVAWIILVLCALSLLVVVAFGLFLSRRFARPLDDLGRAAAAVRAGDRAPMPARGNGDEVDRLARILDGTFASLDEALRRQARFTADAAHELRNPIAVVRNAAEVALRQERTSEEYREFLADVLATSKRMGEIVAALLLLARLDAGAVREGFEDVDILSVASESATAMSDGRRVHVQNGAPSVVRGEAGLLRVLTDNLLSNALRYSKDGPVEVLVGQDDGGRVILTVRDFGPGVPEEAQEMVFERFFRAEAAHGDRSGAGLGLSIVSEVARVHGAECRMESASPGTRVTIRFPSAAL